MIKTLSDIEEMRVAGKLAAEVLEIIAGTDPNDESTKKIPVNMDLSFSKNLKQFLSY